MDRVSLVILWFFIFVRAVIFFGLVYFIVIELRKYRRRHGNNEKRD